MVEKRVFDTIITQFMRSEPSVRIIALIDLEGLPISFAIKSRKYKIKPNQLGSLIKQSYYPIENYSKVLNMGSALAQIYLFEEGSLLLINLGVSLLSILFDTSGWPLDTTLFRDMLIKLRPQLEKVSKTADGLLSKITGSDKDAALSSVSQENISKIMDLISSLSRGKMNPLLTMDSAPAPEIFTKAGTAFDSFMVDEDNNILSMNPNYGPEFVLSTKETLDIEKSMTAFNSGKVLCGLSFFQNNVCIVNGIMGAFDSKNIYMFKKFNDWSVGFNTLISAFYSVANFFVADFASDESMNYIDIIIYVTDSVDDLKERINSYIKEKDFEIAWKFMERAAVLSVRERNNIEAGDIYKWMAFTMYKNGQIKDAIVNYEKAANYHQMGQDLEKAGGDYKDIGSILANQGNISESIENYIKALDNYKKHGDQSLISEVQEAQNTLLSEYKGKISDFINASTGETLTLDYISQKFNLKELIVITILNQLISEGSIGGEVDESRGRYTKTRISTKPKDVKTEKYPSATKQSSSQMMGTTSTRSISPSQLTPALMNIKQSLVNLEDKFEDIGFPFEKYLEYQRLLDQKQFMEQQVTISENSKEIRNNNLCIVCLKEMTEVDHLSECPSGHKAHQICMSTWIKTQDSCPQCNSPLFSTMLKTTYLGVKGSTGSNDDNLAIISQMQQQIAELKEQVDHEIKLNKALKEIKGDEKDLMDKVIRERSLKDKVEKELKRKEMTIRELKSMIKLFKK